MTFINVVETRYLWSKFLCRSGCNMAQFFKAEFKDVITQLRKTVLLHNLF